MIVYKWLLHCSYYTRHWLQRVIPTCVNVLYCNRTQSFCKTTLQAICYLVIKQVIQPAVKREVKDKYNLNKKYLAPPWKSIERLPMLTKHLVASKIMWPELSRLSIIMTDNDEDAIVMVAEPLSLIYGLLSTGWKLII